MQNFDHVTLTLTLESTFRFQKLRLGFENVILAPIPVEGSLLYKAHKCLLTRPLHRHKNFDPYDLDLDLRPSSNRRASLSPGNSRYKFESPEVRIKFALRVIRTC